MNRLARWALAVTAALTALLAAGCGGDDGPAGLEDPVEVAADCLNSWRFARFSASAADQTLYTAYSGRVHVSHDGGDTFRPIPGDWTGHGVQDLRHVAAGFLVVQMGAAAGASTKSHPHFRASVDDGPLEEPAFAFGPHKLDGQVPLQSADLGKGRLVGRTVAGMLFTSVDGGASWQGADLVVALPGVLAVRDRRLLLRKDGDEFRITTDGGKTFAAALEGVPAWQRKLKDAAFGSGERMLFTYEDAQRFTHVMVSEDGGKTVADSQLPGLLHPGTLAVGPDDTAWAAYIPAHIRHQGNGMHHAWLGRSRDFGRTWEGVRPVAGGLELLNPSRMQVHADGRLHWLAGIPSSPELHTPLLCRLGLDTTGQLPLLSVERPADPPPGTVTRYARTDNEGHIGVGFGPGDRLVVAKDGRVYALHGQRRLLDGQVPLRVLYDIAGDAAMAKLRLTQLDGLTLVGDRIVTAMQAATSASDPPAPRLTWFDPETGGIAEFVEFTPTATTTHGAKPQRPQDLQFAFQRLFVTTLQGTAVVTPEQPQANSFLLPGSGWVTTLGEYHWLQGDRVARLSLLHGSLDDPCAVPEAERDPKRCILFDRVVARVAAAPDGTLFAVDTAAGELLQRPPLEAGDAPWQVVARGFLDPVDVAVQPNSSPPRVFVLDGDVFLVVPQAGTVLERP